MVKAVSQALLNKAYCTFSVIFAWLRPFICAPWKEWHHLLCASTFYCLYMWVFNTKTSWSLHYILFSKAWREALLDYVGMALYFTIFHTYPLFCFVWKFLHVMISAVENFLSLSVHKVTWSGGVQTQGWEQSISEICNDLLSSCT